MRIRNRSLVLLWKTWSGITPMVNVDNYRVTDCAGNTSGGPHTLAPYNIPASTLDERIEDENRGRKAANYVHHRKVFKWLNTTITHPFVAPNGSPHGKVEYLWGTSDPQWISLHNTIHNTLPAWDLASKTSNPPRWLMDTSAINEVSLKEDCFEKARQLKADALLNIVEANKLWSVVTQFAKHIPQLGSVWGNARRHIRSAAGSYLAWKFGINPVLQDSMAIHRYAGKLKADLESYRSRTTHRFSSLAEGICGLNDSQTVRLVLNGHNTHVTKYSGRAISPPVVRYVLVVKPKVEYLTNVFKTLDFVLSRFSTSPASLAWELTPFSFVADWFVDIRGLCREVDRALGVFPFDIVSFTRSYSYHVETTTHNRYSSPCNGALLDERVCGTSEFKHYERKPVSDSGFSIAWKPRFGKNQAAVSAALIAQKLQQLRARR